MAVVRVGLVMAVVVLVAACGDATAHRVPRVVGADLDKAESTLDRAGLDHDTEGGGLFGIVERSNWVVCEQRPAAGAKATSVTLIVERECDSPSPNSGDAEATDSDLLFCPSELERLGPFSRDDPRYDPRMDWDRDGWSCE